MFGEGNDPVCVCASVGVGGWGGGGREGEQLTFKEELLRHGECRVGEM